MSARTALAGLTVFAVLLAACQQAPPTPVASPTSAVSTVDNSSNVPQGQLAVGTAPAVAPAHVDLAQGTAQWRSDSQSAFQPVTGSFDLPVGGEIRTDAQGQATISFLEGSRISLDKSSQMVLESFDVDGTTPETINARLGRVRLTGGNLTFDVKALPGASAFEFRTDDYVAVIRGLSGSISSQPAAAGQSLAGDFVLTMSQGTALVGCVVQDATANAPKVNILQAGLGQPVHPSPGTCQSIQSMQDPTRASGLLDAYGIALSGPPDAISLVANGDLPAALDKLNAAWNRGVPQPFFPGFTPSTGSLADAARKLSNGTVLQILQPAVPAPGPQGPQGPLGPAGPVGPVGPAGPPGNASDIKRLDTLEVAGALALTGETIANAPIRANSGITVTGDQPLLIDDAGGIIVGSGPAQLGGGLSVRGGAGVIGDLSVTGQTNVSSLTTSGPSTLNGLTVNNDAQLQGALGVAQSARVNGDLTVGGNAQANGLSVNGSASVDSLAVGRDANVGGSVSVGGSEAIGGDATVAGGLSVSGPAHLNKGTTIDAATVTQPTIVSPVIQGGAQIDSVQVGGSAQIGGNTQVGGSLDVSGPANVHGDVSTANLTVGGNSDVAGQLGVQGNATLRGALGVAGDISSTGSLTLQRGNAPQFQVVAGSGDTLVGGKLAVGNDFSIAGDKFTVNAGDGSTTVKGGALTVENGAGGQQFQVAPATGMISVASKAGIDNFPGSSGELDLGTTNATRINVGSAGTGTLSLTNKVIEAQAQTLNFGRGDSTTAVNLGNSTTGQISLSSNTVFADAATVNIGTQTGKNINLGNSNAAQLNGSAQAIALTGGTSLTADAPNVTVGGSSKQVTLGNSSGGTNVNGSTIGLTAVNKLSADASDLALGQSGTNTVELGLTSNKSTAVNGGALTLTGGASLTADAALVTIGTTANTTQLAVNAKDTTLTSTGNTTVSSGKTLSAGATDITMQAGDTLSADATKNLNLGTNATGSVSVGNDNASVEVRSKSWQVTPDGSVFIGNDQSVDTRSGGSLNIGNANAASVAVGRDKASTVNVKASNASVNVGQGAGTVGINGQSGISLSSSGGNVGVDGTTLNLQKTSNGPILTGKGLVTTGGALEVTGTTTNGLTVDGGGALVKAGGLTVGVGTAAGDLQFTGGAAKIAGSDVSVQTTGPLAFTGGTSLTLTGSAPSTWDIGNNLLSLQTDNNGEIKTGTGKFSTGGALDVVGKATLSGGLAVDNGGSITVGANGTLSTPGADFKVASAGALLLTGNAPSTWDIGVNELKLQSSGGAITTGAGKFTTGGALDVKGKSTFEQAVEITTGDLTIDAGNLTVKGFKVNGGATETDNGLTVNDGGSTVLSIAAGGIKSSTSITPTNNLSDLGSSTNRWQNVWVSGDVNTKNLIASGDVTANNGTVAAKNVTSSGGVGFYGQAAQAQQAVTTPDAGGSIITTNVCQNADATNGCTKHVDVASSDTAAEVVSLQARVNQLEAALKAYGLLTSSSK